MWHHLGIHENKFLLVIIYVDIYRAIYFFAYANTKLFLVEQMERETPLVHVTSAAAAGRYFIMENAISMSRHERNSTRKNIY